MPTMKTQEQIREMLNKVAKTYSENEDADTPLEGITVALEWALGHHEDVTIEVYFAE